jgi:hypothetical protein
MILAAPWRMVSRTVASLRIIRTARPQAIMSDTFIISLAPSRKFIAMVEAFILARKPETRPIPRKRAAISSMYQPLARIP